MSMETKELIAMARPAAPGFEDLLLFPGSGAFGGPRQAVVLITWVGATPHQCRRYIGYLISKGQDVIWLRTRLWHALRPEHGRRAVTRLLELLRTPAFAEHDWTLYTFCIGGYLTGQLLDVVHAHPGTYAGVIARLRAQVVDSHIDWHAVPRGVAWALLRGRHWLLRYALIALVWCLLMALYPLVTRKLIKASRRYRTTPPRVPVLAFASHGDEVLAPSVWERALRGWESQGVRVRLKVWDDSPHVEHGRWHEEEYFGMLDEHLAECLPHRPTTKPSGTDIPLGAAPPVPGRVDPSGPPPAG
jgi:hypothetical protein